MALHIRFVIISCKIILFSLLMQSCTQSNSSSGHQPEVEDGLTDVETISVPYSSADRSLEVVGTSRARFTALLSPETEGRVEKVLAVSGQYVENGVPLLMLENKEEILAVQSAKVEVRKSQQLLDRYARLEGTGAISALQQDEAENAKAAAQVSLAQAELALAERSVLAPFSGYVGLININPGTRINSATTITRIDDRSVLYIDFELPEELFGLIGVNDKVTVAPFEDLSKQHLVSITAFDNGVDATSRTFIARAEINNVDDTIRPGMSFRVSLFLDDTERPVIPEAAILWSSRGAYIWQVVDGRAQRVPVTIASRKDGNVFVDADIPVGAVIVSEGVQKVRDGDLISVPVIQTSAHLDQNAEVRND